MDINEKIAGIEPYSDAQVAEAVQRMAAHPQVFVISKFLFPEESPFYLKNILKDIKTAEEFQQVVMRKAVDWVLDNTTDGLSFSGVEHLREFDGKFLAMSNHRDIVLDPALTQYVLLNSDIPMMEIAVGDNLLENKMVEYMLRCNRMITVIRGISARELYMSSMALSNYIRQTVDSGKSSVWIAQKQGRSKTGIDATEQGLLKMLDMSGTGSFCDNFQELNIIPVSISYEFEPCDMRKAREMLLSQNGPYVKKPHEDTHSIIVGIRQTKGHVHLNFGKRLPMEVFERAASSSDKKDRYNIIRNEIDRQIIDGYKLWPTNFLAYDKVYKTNRFADRYTAADVQRFEEYTLRRMKKVEKNIDKKAINDIFLKIYSNPVESKLKLNCLE